MRLIPLVGILASVLCACGDNEQSQTNAQQDTQNAAAPSALGKSKPSAPTPRIESRAYDPAKATPEQLAARERLEQRLAKSAIETKERNARRAEEQTQRLAQMTEQMTTRLREADTDGDGLIAQSEATGPFERRFVDVDANRDGFLDATEQKAMMATIEERLTDRGGGGGRDRERGGRGRGGR